MSKTEKTSISYNCDYCGSSFTNRSNHIEFTTGQVGQGTDWHTCTMSIKLHGVIPYGAGDADICKSCAKKFLQTAMEKL